MSSMHHHAVQQTADQLGSPRSALHTAAAAAAIWKDSSSPEPPQRCASPTKLGAGDSKGAWGRPSGSPPGRGRARPSTKLRQQSAAATTAQLPAGQDEVSLTGCSACTTQDTPAVASLAPYMPVDVLSSQPALCTVCREVCADHMPIPCLVQDQEDGGPPFQSGVHHAGWLWRRFGHGHKATWKKLWVGCAVLGDARRGGVSAAATAVLSQHAHRASCGHIMW